MKRKISGVLLCLFAIMCIMGCTKSSTVENIAVVQKLPDFQKIVQIMKLSGPFDVWTAVDNANPELEKQHSNELRTYSGNIIIYRTKSDGFRLVTITTAFRPPKITAISKEFK